MPVTLHGSCHCGEVNYTVESNTPVPYQMCSCSICRMTGGFMGNVNIMANTNTLKVTKGEDKISKYVAHKDGKKVNSTRNFCSNCSSMLWLHDPSWDAWVYPFAASIVSPKLPEVPAGEFKVILKCEPHCPTCVPTIPNSKTYEDYGPGAGIEEWHKKNGQWVE